MKTILKKPLALLLAVVMVLTTLGVASSDHSETVYAQEMLQPWKSL